MLENYRFLARYNRWFNERLYQACATLSDEARKLDRGAFFGSVHISLNHLVWGDTLWLGRFAMQDPACQPDLTPDMLTLPEGARFETVLFEDFAALSAHRARLDHAIETWVAALPPDFTARTMRYSNTKGVVREHPMWQAMTHFFNHQTHHRGQITTLLTQAGVDVGQTDLIALAANP
jgi:uncharacterized damage-inducible protein DinB